MKKIKVGLGTCGISAGGELVYEKLKSELINNNIEAELCETGCNGMCYEEVLVEVEDEKESNLYSKVTVDRVGRIINEHIVNNQPVKDWIIKSKDHCTEESFLKNQTRIVLRNCGIINPASIDEYISKDGYKSI